MVNKKPAEKAAQKLRGVPERPTKPMYKAEQLVPPPINQTEAIAGSLKARAADLQRQQSEQAIKQKPTASEDPAVKKSHLAVTSFAPGRISEPKPIVKNSDPLKAAVRKDKSPAITKTKSFLAEKETAKTASNSKEQAVSARADIKDQNSPKSGRTETEPVVDEASAYFADPRILESENGLPTAEVLLDNSDSMKYDTLASQEIVLDGEIMKTFGLLLEWAAVETESAPVISRGTQTVLMEDEIILQNLETVESEEANIFEDFVMQRVEREVFLEIDEIRAVANEQPLEESLACLATLLQEAPSKSEDVVELVDSLARSFTRTNHENALAPETSRITPEITQKLLSLLRLIGYQSPQEVLLEFITRHDLEFLIQALRYLAQLAQQDNQPELLPFKPFNPFLQDAIKPITYRLGKVVLELAKGSMQFSTVKIP